MDTQIQIPPTANVNEEPISRRSQIISELKNHLSELGHNIEVFEIYVFDKDNLPLIVIKDSDDDVEAASFETIRHTLSVSLVLITSSYSKNDDLVKDVLHKLKSFEYKFNSKSLNAINRSGIQVLDQDYIATEIKLTFSYQTKLWSL